MTCCLCSQIKKLFVMPHSAIVILAAGIGSLITAFVAQYFFDDAPCVLCLWQRVPYIAVIPLAAIALMIKPYGKGSRVLLGICALIFLTGMSIAAFHTGVERHWWTGTEGCELTPLNSNSEVSLKDQLLNTASVRCDQVNWTILGLTMANWNVLASFGLAMFCLIAAFVRFAPSLIVECRCCKAGSK